MKKLVLAVLFTVGISTANNASVQKEEIPADGWCFNTWTFAYNSALAVGYSVEQALIIAIEAFDTCVENQQ